MAILTGDELVKMREAGRLNITPFDAARVGLNSYDLTLSDRLLTYVGARLDTRAPCPTEEILIPEGGLELRPGVGYLAGTVESCGSDEFVCHVDGRSSIGRLFLMVHVTAGRGDLGFGCGIDPERWTLELVVVGNLPVVVHAGDRIAQATFHTTAGPRSRQYIGRYRGQKCPTASRNWMKELR